MEPGSDDLRHLDGGEDAARRAAARAKAAHERAAETEAAAADLHARAAALQEQHALEGERAGIPEQLESGQRRAAAAREREARAREGARIEWERAGHHREDGEG